MTPSAHRSGRASTGLCAFPHDLGLTSSLSPGGSIAWPLAPCNRLLTSALQLPNGARRARSWALPRWPPPHHQRVETPNARLCEQELSPRSLPLEPPLAEVGAMPKAPFVKPPPDIRAFEGLVVLSVVPGGYTIFVSCGRICPGVQQDPDDGGGVPPGRPVEGGGTALVSSIYLRPGAYQDPDYGGSTGAHGCPVEGGASVLVPSIYLRPGLQQDSDDIKGVVGLGRPVEGVAPSLVRTFTSTPTSSRSLTTAALRRMATRCRRVALLRTIP